MQYYVCMYSKKVAQTFFTCSMCNGQVSIMTFLYTEALYILDVTVTQVLVHSTAPVQVIILKFVGKSVMTQYSCKPY